MTIKPEFHWMFRLRGLNGRKGSAVHLAASDESGGPLSVTVCGKRYDPPDRIDASKGIKAITGSVCAACLGQLGDTFAQLRKLALSAGKSEQEAVAFADEFLKLRRDSE